MHVLTRYHSLLKERGKKSLIIFWTVWVSQKKLYFSSIFKHLWREGKPVVWGEPKGIWENSLYLKKWKVLQEGVNLWHQILPEMVSSRMHLITVDLLADLSKFVLTDLSVNLLRSRHNSSVRTYIISYSVKIFFFLAVASDLVVNSN